MKRIAVLITCHNRRITTIECLKSLYSCHLPENILIQTYLVDDGSTDATGDAVKLKFPKVEVIKGDGALFWCGGMRLAFDFALKKGYDFYLWLNDDTILNENALSILIDTYFSLYKKIRKDVIVIGSVCDSKNMKITYGGLERDRWWQPLHYELIQPSKIPHKCDLFKGNCVLIPQKIALATGTISNSYKQGPGDIDYAKRAARNGFSAWICPGFIGTCSKNELLEKWKDKSLPVKERIKALRQPIDVIRTKDWVVYSKKYHKALFPYFLITANIKLRLPRLYLFLKTLR
jgi:GT2 family glycosyltransferase